MQWMELKSIQERSYVQKDTFCRNQLIWQEEPIEVGQQRSNFFHVCVSRNVLAIFCVTVTKTPNKNNLRQERLMLAHSS